MTFKERSPILVGGRGCNSDLKVWRNEWEVRTERQGAWAPLIRNVFMRGSDGQILKEWLIIFYFLEDR